MADYKYDIVKKGDTLIGILRKHQMRIYGKTGTLKKVVALNKSLHKGNGNKIYPGMKIALFEIPEVKPNLVETAKSEIPTPTEDVQSNESRKPGTNFNQNFYWTVSPIVSWKNLNSTDSNAYLQSTIHSISDTSYGVGALYGMNFSADVKVYSIFLIEKTSFKADNTINLLKKDLVLTRLAVGSTYKHFDFELAMDDQLFLLSPSYQTVDIKKMAIPEFKTTFHKDFYQLDNGAFAYHLNAKMFIPRASQDINSKLSFGLGGALSAKLFNQSFTIGYDRHYLKTSSNSTTFENIYWKYTWESF